MSRRKLCGFKGREPIGSNMATETQFFFHQFESGQRKKNWVSGLIDDQGVKHEDNDTMKEMVKDYFVNLFSSEVNHIEQSVLSDVNRRVTTDMNHLLLAPFDREEVRKALFSIGDLKAPGPDGLHAIFLSGFGVCLAMIWWMKYCRRLTMLPFQLGGTRPLLLCMIPKVNNPEKVAQFRPISLCNVVYKVISKVLSNRLKVILPDIISHHQSAFCSREVNHR